MRLFILILLLFSSIQAKENFANVKVDKVTSIYDGDTFRANIKGYPNIIGKSISIRINGIDTPEIKCKCKKEKQLSQKAKQFTINILRSAKIIVLKNLKRGKYFRIIADVYADDKNLAQELIKNNLAVIYNGDTKIKDWCK